jgi:CRISPR system Cascade subunit CasA
MRIRHRTDAGVVREADLFGTFAALARDEVEGLPALRPHQRHPFHAFAAQVGALALLEASRADIPEDAASWEALLLALTPLHPGGEAWQLVVDDWSKPALLQPPGMTASDKRATTPDELDMLVTGRNHDLKGARMEAAEDDDWLFALVSLQTQEGWGGATNYWISRMNSGYGARVALGLSPASQRPGAAFRRDVARLLAIRDKVEETSEAAGALALVWTEPWDGTRSISFDQLDPYYIEICRRVRLTNAGDGSLRAVLAGSKAPRIEAGALKGVTGDPWAPVMADGSKSWGVSASGFGYRKMTDLLDARTVTLPPLADLAAPDAEGMVLHAAAVARGQGKTEGFHERTIPVPARARSILREPGGTARLGAVVGERREAAAQAQRILRHALFTLHQGGPSADKLRLDDEATAAEVRRWELVLDTAIDAAFFDAAFWDEVAAEGPQEDVRARFGPPWRKRLRAMARDVLERALDGAPRTQMRRLRAKAKAVGLFEGRMAAFVEPDPAVRQAARAQKESRDAPA